MKQRNRTSETVGKTVSTLAGAQAGEMTCEQAQRMIALAAMAPLEVSSVGVVSLAEGSATRSGNGRFLNSRFPVSPAPAMPRVIAEEDQALFAPLAPELEEGLFRAQNTATAVHEVPVSDALAVHLAKCRDCQAEMAATTAFFRALAQDAGPEPSATLLARSRMRLEASLDSCEHAPLWTRLGQQLSFTAGRLRAAPVLSSGLLVLGLLAGGYGGYRAGHAAHNEEQTALLLAPPAPETPSVVADVSAITRDPASGLVTVHYDRLEPDALTAPASDPSVRELLMIGTENGIDPQVRNLSVGMLSSGCQGAAPCTATTPALRNALLNALVHDAQPEVRREALAGLQPFIGDDLEVRDAVMTALMSDPSATVRIEAVRMLQPVDVDSSVRQVLHTVANRDGDPVIRSASLAALKNVPQVQ